MLNREPITDDLIKLMASCESSVAARLTAPIQLFDGMFASLETKLLNIAEGYEYELTEKYGEQLLAYLTECHRITMVALAADGKRAGESVLCSWAWLGAAYVVDGLIESALFGRLETNEEFADFLDCMALNFLIIAAVHGFKNDAKSCGACIFEATEARRLSDHVLAASVQKKTPKEVLSEFGRAGAQARHQENYEMKAEVFKWCDAYMGGYKSMDAAASAVVEAKLVPVVFRTVRAWVGEWKRQSAGRQ